MREECEHNHRFSLFVSHCFLHSRQLKRGFTIWSFLSCFHTLSWKMRIENNDVSGHILLALFSIRPNIESHYSAFSSVRGADANVLNCLKQDRESTEGYSKSIVQKNNDKVRKRDWSQQEEHIQVPKGPDQVSGGVSVPCRHATPVVNVLWKPLKIR